MLPFSLFINLEDSALFEFIWIVTGHKPTRDSKLKFGVSSMPDGGSGDPYIVSIKAAGFGCAERLIKTYGVSLLNLQDQ